MTSVPPTQPPAAPESDARLTEAEREAVNVAVDEAETCLCCGDDYGSTHVYAAVERIVAERVRVVEGERDALKQQVLDEWATLVGRMTTATARTESAEAAHRALQAAVEALAADFDSNVDWSAGRNNYGDNEAWESAARQVRALAGGAR